MLNYVKLILEKVSFDPLLFEKELRKNMAHILSSEELSELKSWCYENFGTIYEQILNKYF